MCSNWNAAYRGERGNVRRNVGSARSAYVDIEKRNSICKEGFERSVQIENPRTK